VNAQDGDQVTIDCKGGRLKGTRRGAATTGATTAVIRLEQVAISRTPSENAIRLPLSTCMYLGDRWECLFDSGDASEASIRAYSSQPLAPGEYWLAFPQDSLWVF
jgi:iron(III) transport system ATP-binding protein